MSGFTCVNRMALVAAAVLLGSIAAPSASAQSFLSYRLEAPEAPLKPGEVGALELVLSVASPWYIYAPTGTNASQGMIETTLKMGKNEAVQFRPAEFPDPEPYKSFDVLRGDDIVVTQPLRFRPSAEPGAYQVHGTLDVQLCKADLCLPPDRISLKTTLTVTD